MRTALRGSWRLRALVLLGGLALVVGGIAWAAIPQDGVYTGCFMKSGGTLRIIDAAQKCKSSEMRITWNQQGPQGIQGIQGVPGSGGTAPRALAQSDVYQTGESDQPLHMTPGKPYTLVSLPKPDGGIEDGDWNRAVVTATINIGTLIANPTESFGGTVQCRVPNGGAMVIRVDPMRIYSETFTTVYTGGGEYVELICTVQNQSPAPTIWVGWADLAVIPASYAERINHYVHDE